MPLKLSRYNLANLNTLTTVNGNFIDSNDVEVGSEIKIHHETNSHNEAFGHDQVLITKYITLRFGYWFQVPVEDLANALCCSPEDVIVNVMEDDDCSDRYHYLIPCDSYYHSINI